MKRWKVPIRLEEDLLGAYVEYRDAVRAVEEVHQSYGGLPSKCDEQQQRIAKLEAERDHANMVADAADAKIKELEAHRVPNPGVVGTLQDKNTLLEYKDAQIARLQARVQELEARTSDKDSDSEKGAELGRTQ